MKHEKHEKKRKGLVPKLRFPEFRDAGEWEIKTLGEITFKVSNKNSKGIDYPVYSINNKDGFIPQSEQFDGVNSNQRGYDISLYKIIGKNTFAYNPARINVGSIGYSGELQNIIISSLYVCFKTKEIIDDTFLLHFFNTFIFNVSVKNSVEGGIRNYLFYENFSKINVSIPKINEQQKIADCLTSLDELITAEAGKLEAYKAHKKGLMQKLFPADTSTGSVSGETVPEWRFPEFRDCGEWSNEPLEKLYSFKVTNSFSREKLTYKNGSVKNIHYGDIHTKFSTLFDVEKEAVPFINPTESLEKIKKESYCIEGDIIFADASEDLDDVGKNIELVNLNNEKLLSGLHTLLARQKIQKLIIGFGGYLFKSSRIRKQIQKEAQGAKVFGISAGRLANIRVCFPENKHEQKKIADCLSSLDELITAQAQKIEALKTHKKGLMQGLFPSADENI